LEFKRFRIIGLIFLILMLFSVIASVSATCNVLVITDPTGEDPNGAAAGMMGIGMMNMASGGMVGGTAAGAFQNPGYSVAGQNNGGAAPAEGGSNFCPDCGKPTNGSKFCPNCGKQLQ
jgi:membrane protease subunit (stomatin/prohibitin family)